MKHTTARRTWFSPGRALRAMWRVLCRVPGGRTAFSTVVGAAAPYTGTIGARAIELSPGYAKMLLHDRRRVRNYLSSVHPIALANLAEVTTGLAMTMAMPDNARCILVGLSMEYLKKARGTLSAECRCEVPEASERREITVRSDITNAAGEVVAHATARWLVAPTARGP